MRKVRHAVLCILSVGMSSLLFWISGLLEFVDKVLHVWSRGLCTTFLAIFIVAIFLAFRGKARTAAWPVLVGALIGYGAAAVVYGSYYAGREVEQFVSVSHVRFQQFVFGTAVLFPVLSLSWLFGGMAGAFYILSARSCDNIATRLPTQPRAPHG